MSDLWEAEFGFSTRGSVPLDEEPDADPDFDGQTNLAESIAGTDPRDPAVFVSGSGGPGGQLQVEHGHDPFSREIEISWWGIAGKEYLVESSTDLVEWLAAAGPIAGEDMEIALLTGVFIGQGSSSQAQSSGGGGGSSSLFEGMGAIEENTGESSLGEGTPASVRLVEDSLSLDKPFRFLVLSATVYDEQFTEVTWYQNGRKMEALSSVNFNLLSSPPEIETTEAIFGYVVLVSNVASGENANHLSASRRENAAMREIAGSGPLGYRIVEPPDFRATGGDDLTAGIDALHAYFRLYQTEIAAQANASSMPTSSAASAAPGSLSPPSAGQTQSAMSGHPPVQFWRTRAYDRDWDADGITDWEDERDLKVEDRTMVARDFAPTSIRLTASDPAAEIFVSGFGTGSFHGDTYFDSATGIVEYIPDQGFLGRDYFTYLARIVLPNGTHYYSRRATVTIEVVQIDEPTIVDAGADQEIVDGDPLILNGIVRDPDYTDFPYFY